MLSPLSDQEAAYALPELPPATPHLLQVWTGWEEMLISAQLPMCLLYLCLSFSGKWKTTNVHKSTLGACTGSSSSQKHCLNKGKLRNVPVEVASGAVWHLLCLYRLVGFDNFFKKKKPKNEHFLQVETLKCWLEKKEEILTQVFQLYKFYLCFTLFNAKH